ncbi:MAG: transcriptional activator NhaR [Deltaproteobacteria bacterium]|nr:transcriptional activator NhaR [Deltaproteobacteria bacterium]
MEWLNYHHLLYFWVVAKEGGLAPAGKVLRLAHPTLSGQIRALENALGEKLFAREGRRLVLTETGRVVYRYAEEIFTLGREMVDTVKDRPTGQPLRIAVGVADVLSKVIVHRLLEPALRLEQPVRLLCREGRHDRLLAELASHGLDLVLADAPVPPGSPIRAYTHLLGESGVSFFGRPEVAGRFREGFPGSMSGAPVLLPLDTLPIRRSLDQWFDSIAIRPLVRGEFEDSALLTVFGAEGLGLFPAPSVVADELKSRYGVDVVGSVPDVRERIYAISVERRIQNAAAVAICDAAREALVEKQ